MLFQENFVLSWAEESPIVLSIPHDGIRPFHQLPKRPFGTKVHDISTWQIASLIMDHFPKVSYTYGLMLRSRVDYNRSLQGASLPDLEKYYRAYHWSLTDKLITAYESFGWALLIDVHGFVRHMEGCDLVLGTAHRSTITHGYDEKLARFMMDRGYRVFLPDTIRIEGEKYTGGHIVRSQAFPGIDAIQIEIHRKFRDLTPESRELRKQLAKDLAEFLQEIVGQSQ